MIVAPNAGVIAGPRGLFELVRTFSTGYGGAGGNVAMDLPAGDVGQMMVAQIGYRDSPQFSMPSGWTVIYQASVADTAPSGQVSVMLAYKVRGASEPNPTFTRTGGGSAAGYIVGYAPSLGGLSLQSFSQNNNGGAISTTHSTGSLTTVGRKSLLVVFIVKSFNWTTTAPGLAAASLAATASSGTLVSSSPTPVLTTEWQNSFRAARTIGNVVGTQGFDLLVEGAVSSGTISIGSMANTSYHAVGVNFAWI